MSMWYSERLETLTWLHEFISCLTSSLCLYAFDLAWTNNPIVASNLVASEIEGDVMFGKKMYKKYHNK